MKYELILNFQLRFKMICKVPIFILQQRFQLQVSNNIGVSNNTYFRLVIKEIKNLLFTVTLTTSICY